MSVPAAEAAISIAGERRPFYATAYALSKPRVTLLVWLTTVAGAAVGMKLTGETMPALAFAHTLIGSWLVIASANAFNQVLERVPDSVMKRTRTRPLPSGELSPAQGILVASIWGVAGVSELGAFVNLNTALLGALSILLYVLAYTPLKTKTHLATAVGAIPGAIPPLAGYVAAANRVDVPALLLFAVQFVWQFPHFWSIAWLLREDYAAAGFKMLPYPGAEGKATGWAAMQYAAALVPLTVALALFAQTALLYLMCALLLSFWLLRACYRFYEAPDDANARKLLKATVFYLPLLLLVLVLAC